MGMRVLCFVVRAEKMGKRIVYNATANLRERLKRNFLRFEGI